MFRRRPLARAAVIGGGAYALGKSRARNEAYEQQAYDDQAAAAAAPAQGPGVMSDAKFAELEKLGRLKDEGVLTQEEFDAQKAKILQGF
jgi:putative oligomerization/nucleic acid binding protein